MSLTPTERELKHCIAWLGTIADMGCERVERERGPINGPFKTCKEAGTVEKNYCRSCKARLALELMQDERHMNLTEGNKW